LKPRRLLAMVVLTMLPAVVVFALPVTAAPQVLATVGGDLTTAKPGPGDPNGFGNVEVEVYKARVCYVLNVNNIKPATAAHIHRGVKGHTGPIVVPTDHHSSLNPPRPNSVGSSSGASSGCEVIPPALSMKLRHNSQRYYVDVHNKPYPHGAIRSQLFLGM
jgi:CHRD domain